MFFFNCFHLAPMQNKHLIKFHLFSYTKRRSYSANTFRPPRHHTPRQIHLYDLRRAGTNKVEGQKAELTENTPKMRLTRHYLRPYLLFCLV